MCAGRRLATWCGACTALGDFMAARGPCAALDMDELLLRAAMDVIGAPPAAHLDAGSSHAQSLLDTCAGSILRLQRFCDLPCYGPIAWRIFMLEGTNLQVQSPDKIYITGFLPPLTPHTGLLVSRWTHHNAYQQTEPASEDSSCSERAGCREI